MPSVPDRPAITPQLAASGVVAILRGSTDRHLQGVLRTLGEAGRLPGSSWNFDGDPTGDGLMVRR